MPDSIEPGILPGNLSYGDPPGYYNPASGIPYAPYGWNPFSEPIINKTGYAMGPPYIGFSGGTDTNPTHYYNALTGGYGKLSSEGTSGIRYFMDPSDPYATANNSYGYNDPNQPGAMQINAGEDTRPRVGGSAVYDELSRIFTQAAASAQGSPTLGNGPNPQVEGVPAYGSIPNMIAANRYAVDPRESRAYASYNKQVGMSGGSFASYPGGGIQAIGSYFGGAQGVQPGAGQSGGILGSLGMGAGAAAMGGFGSKPLLL